MFTYLQADKKITAETAFAFPVIVVGRELTQDPHLIRVFKRNGDFSQWADGTPYGIQIREVLRTVGKQVVKERRNEASVKKEQKLALKNKIETFAAFAKLHHKDPRHEEVIRLAMIDRTPLTPRLFDPALLYDRIIEREPPMGAPEDPRTNWLPVSTGYWPNLGWAGWNDRARSGRIFGLNILCQHTWFGGRWAWLVGFNMLLNLRNIGFEAITSSVISI